MITDIQSNYLEHLSHLLKGSENAIETPMEDDGWNVPLFDFDKVRTDIARSRSNIVAAANGLPAELIKAAKNEPDACISFFRESRLFLHKCALPSSKKRTLASATVTVGLASRISHIRFYEARRQQTV